MKVLLINLDRSSERLKRMEKIFAQINVNFQRVTAVDGKKLSKKQIEDYYPNHKDNLQNISLGKMGCVLSHRKCWEMLVDSADNYAAIFEDDMHLSQNASYFLQNDDWLPKDFDVIKLETNRRTTRIKNKSIPLPHEKHLAQLLNMHAGTGGYIISRKWAKKLLEASKVNCGSVSGLVFNPSSKLNRGATIYQMISAICVQERRIKSHLLRNVVPKGKNFLPSDIDSTQPKKKSAQQIIDKLKKETLRPLHQLYEAPCHLYTNLFTSNQYTKIGFEDPVILAEEN